MFLNVSTAWAYLGGLRFQNELFVVKNLNCRKIGPFFNATPKYSPLFFLATPLLYRYLDTCMLCSTQSD